VHSGHLHALVCPDARTLEQQQPCTLRVYVLDLVTLQWTLASPRSSSSATEAPLPRKDAACTFHDGKARLAAARASSLL